MCLKKYSHHEDLQHKILKKDHQFYHQEDHLKNLQQVKHQDKIMQVLKPTRKK